MIKVIFARIFETALNQILLLDPSHYSFLQKNNGRVVALNITDIHQHFYLILRAEKIYLYTSYAEIPDTIIRGNFIALAKQFFDLGRHSDLTIEGDIELAQEIQQLIHGIDINWEEYLSYFVGDYTTNRVGNFLTQAHKSTTQTFARSVENVLEYVQEEKQFLPTREEVEDFYDEVVSLRNALDRLEARWNRIRDN